MARQNDVAINCECGTSLPVGFRDAGRQITCNCGKSVDIPRLSELRKLVRRELLPEKLEALSSQQIFGRYFFGVLFSLMLCGMIYQLMDNKVWYSRESDVYRIGQVLGIILFATLAWFTLLGRVWARLIIIVCLLFGSLILGIALVDLYHTTLVVQLVVNVILVICLLVIKT